MKITDTQILESVNLYLLITGDSREAFLDSLRDLADQAATDRFQQIKVNKNLLTIAN